MRLSVVAAESIDIGDFVIEYVEKLVTMLCVSKAYGRQKTREV